MNKNILICGCGGQGTVLASKIIAAAAMKEGFAVHSAETIGMAQRGGSVTSHVRIGDDVFSPLIPSGKADIMLAFEPAEAVRNLRYLSSDGFVIVNSRPTKPVTESLKPSGYSGEEMLSFLGKKVKCLVLDSENIAEKFGSDKFFNIAMLGAACGAGCLGLSEEVITGEISDRVPQKFIETNIEAFHYGKSMGKR